MAETVALRDTSSYLMEPVTTMRTPIWAARALVHPSAAGVPARLVNPGSEPITVHKGTKIGVLEQIDQLVGPVTESTTTNKMKLDLTPAKQAQLWQMVENAEEKLSDEETNQLYELLCSFADVFADDSEDLGRTDLTQHRIHTGDAQPVHQAPRRLPAARREETRKLLQNMLQRDIIQPSNSPWSSPIVLVRKNNGTLRFCIDYRRLNRVTRKDAYPLPRVDDALDMMSGCNWFTTLDLVSGYWQVEVHPQDKAKTAFTTPEGLFEFNVMPFGLCNGPATFQRLMDAVLAGLQWTTCVVYIDDVLIQENLSQTTYTTSVAFLHVSDKQT